MSLSRTEDGRIEATATCDSLARELIMTREELETARSRLQEQYYKPPDRRPTIFERLSDTLACFVPIAVLVAVVLLLKWYRGK